MTLYQTFTLLIPILSATVVGLLTYIFAVRTKRLDLLYQNKIPAFREIALRLTQYRNYCLGRAAYLQGNEYSPFWEDGAGTLHHRTEIAGIVAVNSIFLSKVNRGLLHELLNNMSVGCNMEVALLSNLDINVEPDVYLKEANNVELIIEKLYRDLNLE